MSEVAEAKKRARTSLADWVEETGVVAYTSSRHSELQAIVEEAVESGAKAREEEVYGIIRSILEPIAQDFAEQWAGRIGDERIKTKVFTCENAACQAFGTRIPVKYGLSAECGGCGHELRRIE